MRHVILTVLFLVGLPAFVGSALASDSGEGEGTVDAEDAGEVGQAAQSEETATTEGSKRSATPLAKQPSLAPVDALGRPFPDPEILLKARHWTAGGATLTVVGVSTMMAGMLLGSAALRGQIAVPTEGMYFFAGLLIAGPLLVASGLPLLSSGNFTRGQLTRKIKGVPKVPRTVANEWRYWQAYNQGLYGQAALIAGGAGVMMGVLGLVAGGFSAESEYYRPSIWAFPASAFSAGAGLIIAGLLLQKASRKKMEQIRDEVDPFRQPKEPTSSLGRSPSLPQVSLPLPGVSAVPDGRGGMVARASLSWFLRF